MVSSHTHTKRRMIMKFNDMLDVPTLVTYGVMDIVKEIVVLHNFML
jgi:hypothetical protein